MTEDRDIRATFSPCKRYRYFLAWTWDRARDSWLFVGANPSKAGQRDAAGRVLSDPTVTGQANRARRAGFGALWVVNVRSWIATDPRDVPPDPEAIGAWTDGAIECAAKYAGIVVCGWGHLGGERGAQVLELIRRVGRTPYALALTNSGVPRHPRGIPADARPFQLLQRGGTR